MLTASTRLSAPFLLSTSGSTTVGNSSGLGIRVTNAGGIDIDADSAPLTMAGSSITIGDAGSGNLTIGTGGSAINIGTSNSEIITLGNTGGGSVVAHGSVNLGTGTDDTVTIGGAGNNTISIGASSGDTVTLGASGTTLTSSTNLLAGSAALDLGTSGTPWNRVYAGTVHAETVVATNQQFTNQTLAWSTTLLQDESSTPKMVGHPVACKVLEMDVSSGYYTLNGSTRYYPMTWDDPRATNAADEAIATLSANAQVFNMMVIHSGVFSGLASGSTWNLHFAPQSTLPLHGGVDLTISATSAAGSNVKLSVTDGTTSGLAVGDYVVVSGLTEVTAYNGRAKILATTSNSVTIDVTHTGSDDTSGGTATIENKLADFGTDITAGASVQVASQNILFTDSGFDAPDIGSVLSFGAGPFPVYSMTDADADSYFALSITSSSTFPTAGKVRLVLLSVPLAIA